MDAWASVVMVIVFVFFMSDGMDGLVKIILALRGKLSLETYRDGDEEGGPDPDEGYKYCIGEKIMVVDYRLADGELMPILPGPVGYILDHDHIMIGDAHDQHPSQEACYMVKLEGQEPKLLPESRIWSVDEDIIQQEQD